MLNSGDNTHKLRDKNAKDISGAPNSDLLREVPKLDPLKAPSKSEIPKEAPKSDTLKAQPPKPPGVSPLKGVQSRCIPSPQGVIKKYSRTSLLKPLKATASSTSNAQPSLESVESGSEDTLNKPRNKLNKPRMNRLTLMRIQRLQTAANVPEDMPFSPRLRRQSSKLSARVSLQGSVAELHPSGDTFESALNKLKDLQTEFLQMAAGSQKANNGVYKLVSVVQNDNCKFVLHKDDLVGLTPQLPADLVNDINGHCRDALNSGFAILFDGLSKLQDIEAGGEFASEAIGTELRKQMKSELNLKLEAIEQELLKFHKPGNKSDDVVLTLQISELTRSMSHLSDMNSKLETQLSKMQSSNYDLTKLLNESQMENNRLALELADKNIEGTEQNCKIEDQKKEIKHLKNVNKVVQQRLKENEENLAAQKSESSEVKQKEKLVQKEMTDLKKRVRELSNNLTAKETELQSLQGKFHEQMQKEYCNGTEQSHIKELQGKLELQTEVEKQLTTLVEQKQGLLNKLEQKVTRLEEQLEQHRQVLIVRGERINTLDTEMKQRENESNRKITELMTLTNDKNSVINQIKNELNSTNEQFQNLCRTLSIKQSKLHSQEHVIKLLEESNSRSIKLHTKLGEKNALLKDELERLRHTVNTLMLGNGTPDMEMADIRLE